MSNESGESRLRKMEDYVDKLNGQLTHDTYSYILHQTVHLLDDTQPDDIKRKVWQFYTKIVHERPDLLEQVRCQMFHYLKQGNFCNGDVSTCIDFLIASTHNGRILSYYELNFAELMVHFFSIMLDNSKGSTFKLKKLEHKRQLQFLEYMTNLIKFNSALLNNNPKIITKMIAYVFHLAHETKYLKENAFIFEFLNSVISYSYLPSDSLDYFMITLCNGIKKREHEEICNLIMRNLLGNYRSFSCLTILLHIIEDQTNYNEPFLIAGAISFLSRSLWGDLAKDSVCLSPNTVLSAFHNVLNEAIPNAEITLAVAQGIYQFLLLIVKTTSIDSRHLLMNCRMDRNEKKIVYDTIFEATWELVINVSSSIFIAYNHLKPRSGELNDAIMKIINIYIYDLLAKTFSDANENYLDDVLNYKTSVRLILSNVMLVDKLFATIEMCFPSLEESYIEKMFEYKLCYIGLKPYQFKRLLSLFDVYYFSDYLTVDIRMKCLDKLQHFLQDYAIDVDKFWEEVASVYFNNRPQNDSRELAVNLLVFLAVKSNSKKNLLQLIEVLQKIVFNKIKVLSKRQHSFDNNPKHSQQALPHQHSEPITPDSMQHHDFIEVIQGFVKIFIEKLDHPECHPLSIRLFSLLLNIANNLYNQNTAEDTLPTIIQPQMATQAKLIIFDLILSLRVNSLGQIGVLLDANNALQLSTGQSNVTSSSKDEYNVKYSPYINIDFSTSLIINNEQQLTNQPQTIMDNYSLNSSKQSEFILSFQEAMKLVIQCIDQEKQWSVLNLIFQELPKVLRHKGLLINRINNTSIAPSSYQTSMQLPIQPTFADSLLKSLVKFIDVIQNDNRMNELIFLNVAPKMTKVELISKAYNSLISLVGHKLHSTNQTCLVQFLLNGLVFFSSKSSSLRQCIIALTHCAMEMQTAMNKQLNEIIVNLSKVCTNRMFAVPKLEFLSNIIIFPDLYYTFAIKQYLETCMVAQFYINPYKYGEFTVALALRAISMWFLKCSVNKRQTLVKYLIKGLETNILKEVEPTTPLVRGLSVGNQDRTNSSVDSAHPPSSCSATYEGFILDPKNMDNIEISKMDLVEVCMDMFAANTFTTSSPLPFKSSMVNKLLNDDKSSYWILGHKIIQISTSGCTSRAFRAGLCVKCYTVCHMNKLNDEMDTTTSQQSNLSKLSNRYQTQFSQETSTASSSSFPRRRHRSEMNSSSVANKNSNCTNDDYFIHRMKSQQNENDLNQNLNHYCKCWCQSWAEIFIRRATGNSRWTLKIENNLGDFPSWSYSKEEDESLANIFLHSDNEINLAYKIKKNFGLINDDGNQTKNVSQEALDSDDLSVFEDSDKRVSQDSLPSTDQSQRKLAKEDSIDEAGSQDRLSNASSNESNASTVGSTNGHSNNGYRDRGFTISVMSPAQKSANVTLKSANTKSSSTNTNFSNRQSVSPGGLSPQFVFLQLYYNSFFKEDADSSPDKPILLDNPDNKDFKTSMLRSINVLDCITPYETHKIGLMYVGEGQANDLHKILANTCGSLRYTQLLKDIGQFVDLKNVDKHVCYVGGLDASNDGRYAISWGDHLLQVIFHVATLMPRKDPNGVNKMVHIGNDFVTIVYNNSGSKVDFSTIKGEGQVLQAMILITPLPFDTNIVEVHAPKEFLDFIGHSDPQMISDKALPVYVRQLALHTNLAAMVSNKSKSLKSYHIWNWINRLHKIKQIRTRAIENLRTTDSAFISRSHSLHSQNSLLHHSRFRFQPQISKEDHDLQSPGMYSVGSASGNGFFDYETGSKLTFSDFTSFT